MVGSIKMFYYSSLKILNFNFNIKNEIKWY